jgi:hypothetical protein
MTSTAPDPAIGRGATPPIRVLLVDTTTTSRPSARLATASKRSRSPKLCSPT